MRYLGTNFSLTLGAWRLRFVLSLEDAPDDDCVATEPSAQGSARSGARAADYVPRGSPAAANRWN